jgi:hypothetical protein
MPTTPFIGFSNDTLSKLPIVRKGQTITMPCGHNHVLEADDKGGELLLFYKCGDKLYLAAIDHRLITYTKSDIHGEI